MEKTEDLKLTRYEVKMILFILVVALSNLLSIDMYLPSLPAIETSLGISQAAAQYTISLYLLGLAVSVLFFGPLSDKLGRKPFIIFGLTLNIVGSLLCFKAMSDHDLLFGRLIQGVGAGAALGAMRATVSDIMGGKKLAIFGAYFSSILGLSPIVAPVIGGYLQTYFNWRANFIVLGAYYLLSLIWACFVPETNHKKHLHSFNYKYHLKNYAHLLTEPTFMTYTFCGGLAIAASMAYATSGPFILQKTLGLSPLIFGWMGIFVGAGNVLAKLLTPSLIKRYDMQNTLVTGLSVILASGLILGLALILNLLSVALLMCVVMLSLFGQGLTSSNAVALGVSPYRHIGGAANALWTSMQMGLAFLVSVILSSHFFKANQPAALTSAYIGIGLLSLSAYFLFKKHKKRQGRIAS